MSATLVLSGTTGGLLHADHSAVGVHLLIDYDLGDAQTITAQVEALLLDGERVVSARAGNRTLTLPLLVRGSTRLDLSARVDALLQDIAADGYTLTWTPDGGLPLVWDCMVGQATVRWALAIEDKFVQQVDLTLPALPFGRSDAAETLTLTAAQTESRGVRYTLPTVKGSARSALAVEVDWASAVGSWLIHKPPHDADPAAPILAAVTSMAVTLTGAEKLRGTYSVVLGISTYNAGGQPRTMTVVVGQSGTTETVTLKRDYVSAVNLQPLVVGNITLPLIDRPSGATSSLTFTLSDTGGGLTGNTDVLALMLLDSRGQTVMSLAQPSGVADTARCYLDEPDVDAAVGDVWNSTGSTRASGFAVAVPRIAGGPLAVSSQDAGASLLIFGDSANPSAVVVTHRPRWLAERVS